MPDNFVIPGPPRPDLVVKVNSITPSVVASDGTLTFNLDIKNIGNADSADPKLALYLSTDSTITTADTLLLDFDITGPAARETYGLSFSLPLQAAYQQILAGNYYLGFVIDFTDLVLEKSNANNASAGIPITIDNRRAGFDTSIYPGDPAMDWLKDHTNLEWVAYYLAPAPSRINASWMGQRADLEAQGWSLAPVYVGEQPVDNPASNTSKNPSAAKGLTDGAQTVDELNAEGFAKGTIVYLDVEPGTLGANEIAYIKNWYSAVSAADFIPAVYSRLGQANALSSLLPSPMWVVREFNPWNPQPPVMAKDPDGLTTFPRPHPSTSGYVDAIARQYVLDDFAQYTIYTPTGSFTADLNSVLDPAVIKGTIAGESLNGTGKNDYIFGLSGADTLLGLGGNDRIDGGNGDDIIEGGGGKDVMAGGANDAVGDTASYASALAGVTVSLVLQEKPQNTIGAGTDTLWAFESLAGSLFADTLTGDGNDNTLAGGDGNDTLIGGLGNDTLNGGLGTGDTASYVSAGFGVTVSLAATGAQNTGGAGTDTLLGIERLIGGAFGDMLTGDSLANHLAGAGGDDTIEGGAGNDTLLGGTHGGAGDTVSYASALAPVTVNLAIQDGVTAQNTVGAGKDILSGFENVMGSALADTITGSTAANVIAGGAGNDTLKGGGGNDQLMGGLGDDLLIGGGGNDILTGGDGVDAFLFNSALGATNVDTITDFELGVDRIRLENAIFTKLATTDTLSPEFFVIGTKALEANHFLIYDKDGTGALYYDSNGSGAGGQVQFATLDPGLALTNASFTVV